MRILRILAMTVGGVVGANLGLVAAAWATSLFASDGEELSAGVFILFLAVLFPLGVVAGVLLIRTWFQRLDRYRARSSAAASVRSPAAGGTGSSGPSPGPED